MAMTRQAFSWRMHELGGLVTEAVTYFSAWEALHNADTESVVVLTQYRGHFEPARAGLQLVAVLHVAKLFDKNKRTISIPNLIRAAKLDRPALVPHLDDVTLAEIERRLGAHAPVLRRLKRLRDQRLAHYDAAPKGSRRLTPEELADLVEDVKWIWNELDIGHRQNVTVFDGLEMDAQRHTAALIDALRAAHRR